MRSHARNRAARTWWLLAVALLFASIALTPVLAEDPPQKQENADKADDDEPKVYTTEDLEQKYGAAKSKRAEPAATEKEDEADAEQAEDSGSTAWRGTEDGEQALKSVQDQVARERTRQQQLALAQSRVDELQLAVRRLEDRILRIKNPLLKPPQADMSAQEVAEWDGMSNPQRLEQTQGQLDQARGELQSARAEVVRLNKR